MNDLAMTLRMSYLPGEKIMLELTQKGNDSHQGVGHLADGTMVVVEQAGKYVGSSVEVEFIRSLQTAAGKMMFAKLVQRAPANKSSSSPQGKPDAVVRRTAGRQRTQKATSGAVEQKKEAKAEPRQQAKQQPPQRPARSNNRPRRRTPEDSMVELANK